MKISCDVWIIVRCSHVNIYDGLVMDKFLSPYYFYYNIDSYWINKQEDLVKGFWVKLGLAKAIVEL